MLLRPSLIRAGLACVFFVLPGLAAVGCGYSTKPAATIPIEYDTLTVYSLNFANPYQPTAFDLATNSLVIPDGTISFDIAFNIEKGSIVIYPAKLVVTAAGIPRVVGLQIMSQSFNAIGIASHNGYEFNDSLLVNPGQVFEVVTQNTSACAPVNITSQELLYAKFQIDSINAPNGQIFMRAVVDPNCDFDTLVPGVVPTH
jgi:hypothetical protein